MKKEYLKFKGKNIGYIDHERQTYYSPRTAQDHYFRIFEGYGVSLSVLEHLDKNKN